MGCLWNVLTICLLLIYCVSFATAQDSTIPKERVGFSIKSETQLRDDILSNFTVRIRPNRVTKIDVIFNLVSINELEARTQTFSVSGYFTVIWEDVRLKWNSSDYSGIQFIFSDETEIWKPALVVKNSVDNLSVLSGSELPFRITDRGRVFWHPPGIYQTNCEVDITYYPFDTQTCTIVVQSWAYNLLELDLHKYDDDAVDTDEYIANGEWDLVETSSERQERTGKLDTNTYARVTFILKLKRRTTYYGLNIILPVVVLSLLSALVFTLPADSGEKMGYSLTVLLALAVFLTLISDRMPTTSKHTSFMGIYLSIVLCLNGVAVLLTMYVLKLHFRETPVPESVKKFTRSVLMSLACYRCCCKKSGRIGSQESSRQSDDYNMHTDPRERRHLRGPTHEYLNTPHHIYHQEPIRHSHDYHQESIRHSHDYMHAGSRDGRKPRDPNHVILSSPPPHVARPEDVEREITWREVARILDAVFFRAFMIVITIVTVVLFVILALNL